MLNKLTDATTIDMLDHLFAAGRNEDGEQVLGHVFIIVAETPDGFRFELDHRFCDNTRQAWESDEDGSYPYWTCDRDTQARAEAFMARIQAHLDAGGKLDPAHWTPTQGCYGSRGWDEQAEFALEIREAQAAGEAVPANLLALANL